MSKIEAESVRLEPTEFEIEKYFQKHFAFWEPFADEKQINLVYQKQKNLPKIVVVDCLRLRQCLNNLITNALKFTPKNGTVTVTLSGHEIDGRFALSYSVRDTGIGISQENMDKMFKPFFSGRG